MKNCLSIILCLLISIPSFSENNTTTTTDKMKWWKDARFGLFIHWGVYSVPAGRFEGVNLDGEYVITEVPRSEFAGGGEWILKGAKIPRATYRKYAEQFTAENYDPVEFVKLAKNTGMKYIVITAKHHEGFSLYPTAHSDWNVMNSAAKRDLLAPLIKAARDEGMKIGFYYSQNLDWMHEGGMGDIPEINGEEYSYTQQKEYVEKNVCPTIKELLNYDIDILWYDIPFIAKYKDLSDKIYETVQKYKKATLIENDRLSPWHSGDCGTPEGEISDIPFNGYEDNRNWELCQQLRPSWGYISDDLAYNWDWEEHKLLIRAVESFSKGGNVLFNVGPDRTGLVDKKTLNLLSYIGDWMKINSESVYETERNPMKTYIPYGFFTYKNTSDDSALYFHMTNIHEDAKDIWPKNGKVLLRGLMNLPESVYFLKNSEAIDFEMTDDGLVLNVSPEKVDKSITVAKLNFKKGLELETGIKQRKNGGISLPASDAQLHGTLRRDGYNEDNWVIAYWDNDDFRAQWKINVNQPAIFRVKADYASVGGGGCSIKIGDQTLNGKFPTTAGWSSYSTVELGNITVPISGIYDVDVSIARSEGSGWNLRNLEFELVESLSIDEHEETYQPILKKVADHKFILETNYGANKNISLINMQGQILSKIISEDKDIEINVPYKGGFLLKLECEGKTYMLKGLN